MTGTALAPERPDLLPRRAAPGAWPRLVVPALAVLAALARLPFLTTPLSPDEGGFLMVAGQWHPGTSLYGAYWVDRPPLLITLFMPVARWAHAGVGLHLIGAVAVLLSVLLAGRLAALLVPGHRWAPALGAATAAVCCDSAWFGAAAQVDGELLAVPFVLASLVATLRAAGPATAADGAGPARARLAWWAGAGAAALAAAAVKQSFVDGFVGAAAVLVWLLVTGRRTRAVQGAVALAAGALVALAVLLAWAAAHGTMPGPLWDATVTFRARAGLVLSAEAPSTDTHRWHVLLASFLLSGAPLVILAGLLPRRFHPGWPPRPRARSVPGPLDPRLLMLPLLAWELTAIALGGSYWLHYLIGLVPGLVVTSAAVTRTSLRRVGLVAAVLVWITLSTAVTDARTGGAPEAAPTEVAVQHYLRAHAAPGDTGVVAFGDAVLLQGAGLSSPYENLWSLPVKVRDPHLTRFTAVLESPHRPTWLVVAGASVGTWGVDSTAAQRAADRYYVPRRVIGEWHVFHARP